MRGRARFRVCVRVRARVGARFRVRTGVGCDHIGTMFRRLHLYGIG